MTRTVMDAAIVLDVISGQPGRHLPSKDDRASLEGIVLLVPTNLVPWHDRPLMGFGQQEAFQSGCQTLGNLGADVLEVKLSDNFLELEKDFSLFMPTMEAEFAVDIDKYLQSLKE